MVANRKTAALLSFILGSFLLQSCTGNNCRDVKKRGIKVECPAWTDPACQGCDWWEIHSCDDLDLGTCGRGTKRDTRARTCKFLEEGKNQKSECQDAQDRKENCKLQCGPNGKYNQFLDFCECKENWDGACCDTRIQACTSPIMKNGETDRSIVAVGRGKRCDARIRPSWYMFDSPAGNHMPTECVPYSSCNTAIPFWLNGTHPREEEGVVERWACGTQDKDCCRYRLKIKVRNCGNQRMAYYLVPTQGCMKAYCIGSHEKCPEGQSSDTGFQPGCTNEFPNVKVTPSVSFHIDEAKEDDKVYLTCSGTVADFQLYFWRAQWFFDGEAGLVQQQDLKTKPGQPRFLLPSKDWKNRMGSKCTCALQGKLRIGGGTWSQSHIESKEFFLGIVVIPSEITVKEGESTEITLKPNLPVRCSTQNEGMLHCELAMSLTMDPTAKGPRCPGANREISQVIFEGDMEDHCGFREITHLNWHQGVKLKIKPKVDIQVDGLQTRKLRLHVHEKDSKVPAIWSGHILSPVTINIIDQDKTTAGSCSMLTDPNIYTFDGRYYQLHDRANLKGDNGIFTIYKHMEESEEVQARFFHCNRNNRVYCICGLAVRAGDTTVVFDRCRTQPSLMPELNYKVDNKDKKLDPRMRVFKHRSGTEYHVFLPTGTQVNILDAGRQQIRIVVKGSVAAKNKAVGLCGNYNGNQADDLQTNSGRVACNGVTDCRDEEFINSWAVQEKQSIFAGFVGKAEEHMEELFCDCVSEPGHTGYGDCNYHKQYEPCDEGEELFAPKPYGEDTYPWLSSYRAPKEVNPAFTSLVNIQDQHYYSSFSTVNNWTEVTAREYCYNSIFSSEAVKTCLNEVPNQNYDKSIEACALDLVLTGSKEFAATHIEDIKGQCNNELRMNLALWEPREEEKPVEGEEPKPVVAGPPLRLMENLCPNECSGQGACIDGNCICKSDFSGYDCSLALDAVPTVKGLVSSSIPCDKKEQECHVIALEGINFLEGPKLTCHYYKEEYTERKYYFQGPAKAAPVATSPGILYSLWITQCSVPELLSTPDTARTTFWNLQVALSNDGVRQTDRFSYATYDSSCEQCVNGKCTRKRETCIIGSRCFSLGQSNGADTQKVCNPAFDPFGWSPPPTVPPTIDPATDDGVKCEGGSDDVSVHRDPKNCSMYYVCEGSRRHHMPCPRGLFFSVARKTCLIPREVPECRQ